MGRNKKHKTRSAEDFLRYSGNEMTGRERNIFEKDLQKDPFEAEAMEGLSSISPDNARRDLADLDTRLTGRTQHKNRFIFYRAAAAVAAIIVIGSLILMVTKIGLFPGQIAVTENMDQKSKETIPQEETLIQPGSEKSINEEEVSRSDIATAGQTMEKPVTESQDQVLISEAPGEDISIEVKEQISEPEISIIAEQKEFEITDELGGIVMKDEKTELVHQDEALEIAFKEETVPSLSARKTRSAGEGNMLSGKVRTNLVRGVVVSSEDDLPIPGAFVSVKGTATGTVTDNDGNFEITLQEDTSHTLIADFIGMEKKEIEMSDEEDVRIILEPSESALDEVVVVGYGVQRKADMTGAVTTVEINDGAGYQSACPVPGYRKFREYIENNLQFPDKDTAQLKVVVVLSFIVDGDGRPKDISVVKSPGNEFSNEAIRLLINGPDWFPPEHDGMKVEEETRIRIVFRPDY